MFTKLSLTILIVVMTMLTSVSNAQLSGTINVGSGQTYTTLTDNTGFFNAVNTLGLSGNVTVNITSSITESGTIGLNQWAIGSGFTITIMPSSATVYTLQGTNTDNIFRFNGADNVTIDGRFGGSGRYLKFVNTSTSGSTFRFTNDATGNTIRYCTIEGTNASTSEGVIEFTTTTGTNGNDNNTISNCIMGSYGSTAPQIMIYSNGSTTTTATYNSNNTISNNEIKDFYVNGQVCSGVKLEGGSTDWTISGNSFYQTSTRSPGSATTFAIIYINTSNANNITVSNNYFGGTAANCGGTAWTVSGSASNAWYGIYFANAGTTTASNVNGNYIQNLNLTSSPSSGGVIYFAAILGVNGTINVGNTSGNTIGNTSSTGNITLTYDGTTSNIVNRGIDLRRVGQISNNIIGSVTVSGTNPGNVRFEAIVYSNTVTNAMTISNNTVGSATTANSIQTTNASMRAELIGFYSNSTSGLLNITGNTIANITNVSTNSAAYNRGIYQSGGTYTQLNIQNNSVYELLCSGTGTSRAPQEANVIGIYTGSASDTHTVSGNTIRGIRGNGNAGTYVTAFGHSSPSSSGNFTKNKIYDLTNSSTSGTPHIWAINAYWGSWNYSNNQVTITNGEASDYAQNNPAINNDNREMLYPVDTDAPSYLAQDVMTTGEEQYKKPEIITDASVNTMEIKGVHDEAEFGCTYYYNTIYIGGSQSSGSSNSWAYDRPLSSWPTRVSLRNNLFVNGRTNSGGSTGKHYAIGNGVGSLWWDANTSNYNSFVSVTASTLGLWGTTDQTIAQWKTSSLGDKQTWGTTTSEIAPASLFQSISTGDLRINSGNAAAWIVSGKGNAIPGYTTDYEGNSRPGFLTSGCSDIGADEFTATPPSCPLAVQTNAPGSGVTSTYSLWGRDLVIVNWGTGGSSYPTSLNVRYYSGVNPPSVVGGSGYSNSYWEVIPSGTLTGATYDITVVFGDNETNSISTPNVNTRLAKYNTTWEVFSTAGTGTWQSELTWSAFTVKTRTMNSFSIYALTDATNPLPVVLCSFSASVINREVDLYWSTCSEVNNRGFEIERRQYNQAAGDYFPWIKAGFVDGHGTTNEEQHYRYKDSKLSTGKYQYRLKQVDFNGNYEYHNLTTPNDVIIGTPNAADLFQNYPNPSNPTSKVDYQIPFAGKVSLKVYNITGQEVATLVDAQLEGGYYTAEFNGSNLASGVYFYRLIASSNNGEKFSKTMKLILVK